MKRSDHSSLLLVLLFIEQIIYLPYMCTYSNVFFFSLIIILLCFLISICSVSSVVVVMMEAGFVSGSLKHLDFRNGNIVHNTKGKVDIRASTGIK